MTPCPCACKASRRCGQPHANHYSPRLAGPWANRSRPVKSTRAHNRYGRGDRAKTTSSEACIKTYCSQRLHFRTLSLRSITYIILHSYLTLMAHSKLPSDDQINIIFGVLATIIGITTIAATVRYRCRRRWRSAFTPRCMVAIIHNYYGIFSQSTALNDHDNAITAANDDIELGLAESRNAAASVPGHPIDSRYANGPFTDAPTFWNDSRATARASSIVSRGWLLLLLLRELARPA